MAKEASFLTIDSAPITSPTPDSRLLMRQTRTQPVPLAERFSRSSDILTIATADWANTGGTVLDWSASVFSDFFSYPGYLPMVLAFAFGAGAAIDAVSLLPLPYQLTATDGIVQLEFSAQVEKRDANARAADVRVGIYAKSTRAEPSPFTFGFFLIDGSPNGLVST